MSGAIKLTDREHDIMHVLWQSQAPMLASEILAELSKEKKTSNMSIHTIQHYLKTLLEKQAIVVTDQAKVAKTTARYYAPLLSADQYAVNYFQKYFPNKDGSSISSLVLAFLDNDANEAATLDELEKLLAERKNRLKRRDDPK